MHQSLMASNAIKATSCAHSTVWDDFFLDCREEKYRRLSTFNENSKMKNQKKRSFFIKLRMLHLLPLSLFMQLNDLLALSKLLHDKNEPIEILKPVDQHKVERLTPLIWGKFKKWKIRIDFYYWTRSIANTRNCKYDFDNEKIEKENSLNYVELWKQNSLGRLQPTHGNFIKGAKL